MVNVTVEDPLLNTTVPNSLPFKFAPAKAMVWSEVALKVTVADPADQEAVDEAFVQFPETVQDSDPKAM